MELRKYKTEDCEALAKLFYDTIHTVNAVDYSLEKLNAWADGNVDISAWDKRFLQSNTIIAIIDNFIVGFGNMDLNGYLDMLYVHKDFQGQGIARAICRNLEQQSVSKNFTTHASITAKPFFEKIGYFSIREEHVERKGVELINYYMEKSACQSMYIKKNK